MKNLTSVLLILTLLFSCKSVDSLIEQGDEDVVFENAIKDIESKSELSIKDIQKFEILYNKILANDHKRITGLLAQVDAHKKWNTLFVETKKTIERQKRIEAISPIQDISKTYTAKFNNAEVRSDVIKSIEELTSFFLKEATFFIEESIQTESKDAAKYAYNYLEKIESINPHLSVLSKYKNDAVILGRQTILVAFDEPSIGQIGEANVAYVLGQVELEESVWTHFVYQPDEVVAVDQMIQISIKGISIGQDQLVEESRVTRFSTNKVTLGGSTTITQVTPVFSNEVRKTKQANLKGSITLFDFGSNEVVLTKELDILFEFNNSSFCLLYTSPSPRDRQKSRMPSSA